MNYNPIEKKEVLEIIILSKQLPYKEYVFDMFDFEIKIKNTSLIVDPAISWIQLIQQIEMRVLVSAYSINENATKPAFKHILPIHLFYDPYTKKPFFQLDKVINKDLFDRHINLNLINKFIVKIEFYERISIKDAYELQLEIVK
jgi:hypothetical protein